MDRYSQAPLPTEFNTQFTFNDEKAEVIKAYDSARDAEQFALSLTSTQDVGVIHARVVGYFLLEGPSGKAIFRIAQEVNSCTTPADIIILGQLYTHSIIRACKHGFILFIFASLIPLTVKGIKGRMPTPLSHPSRPSFDQQRKLAIGDLLEYIHSGDYTPEYRAKQLVSITPHAALAVSHHPPS
jgi:hypothetical protein